MDRMAHIENKLALPNGTILKQYEIESVLGSGGFGIVYKARHLQLDNYVAIKEYVPEQHVLREDTFITPITADASSEFDFGIKKFLDEAKQLVNIPPHPNIVGCRDFFNENGTCYLVMDFIEGEELKTLLEAYRDQERGLSEEEITGTVLPILQGLQHIHDNNILHRDIKPSNIFIRKENGEPLLIDFGAAKGNFGFTEKSEEKIHTPGYAPPEQILDEGDLGPWTDIYAVGAMLWSMVTEEKVHKIEANTRYLKINAGETDPVISMLDQYKSNYSPSFISIIKKALALDYQERFQYATEFADALTSDIIEEVPPPKSSKKQADPSQVYKIYGAIAAAAAVLLGLYLLFVKDPQIAEGSPPKLVKTYQKEPTPDPQALLKEQSAQLKREFDVIYSLVMKAELDKEQNRVDALTITNIETLEGAEIDNKTKRSLSILKSAIQRRKEDIRKNLERARLRIFELVTSNKQNKPTVQDAFSNAIQQTENLANYEKAEFFKALSSVVSESMSIENTIEVKEVLKNRISI